eukprot:6172629-Pleurochrysis_carterae.AAC.3
MGSSFMQDSDIGSSFCGSAFQRTIVALPASHQAQGRMFVPLHTSKISQAHQSSSRRRLVRHRRTTPLAACPSCARLAPVLIRAASPKLSCPRIPPHAAP